MKKWFERLREQARGQKITLSSGPSWKRNAPFLVEFVLIAICLGLLMYQLNQTVFFQHSDEQTQILVPDETNR